MAHNEKDTESGLELDRMNLSDMISSDTREPMPGADQKSPAPPEIRLRNRKITFLTLITSLAVLVLIIVISVFFKQQDFSFTPLQGKTDTSPENYLRVGPVSATLPNDDIINLSVDIDCKNVDLKQQLTGKDSQIRDKIVGIITAPDMNELIRKQQYDEIKTRIRESLVDITPEPIGEVYIYELLMY